MKLTNLRTRRLTGAAALSGPARARSTRRVGMAVLTSSAAFLALSAPAAAAPGVRTAAVSVPVQFSLASVSCTGGAACVAVGQRVTGSGRDLTFAEGWNGHRWQVLPQPPSPGSMDSLAAVSCAGRSACMAVGSYETVTPAKPKPHAQILNLAELWNGRAWKLLATPDHGTGNQLTGVSCTAPGRCIAVGWSLAGTIAESWNGSRWRLMTTRNPAPDIALNGVSCATRSDCVTVGAEDFGDGPLVAEVWNGRSWQVRNPPNPSSIVDDLASVSCPSPAGCTAVGNYLIPPGPSSPSQPRTLADGWDGKTWRMLQAITPAGTKSGAGLHGVACVRASSCLAIGGAEERLIGEYWNGHAWRLTSAPRQQPIRDVASNLFGIACWQARRCMAVGDYFGASEVINPLAEEWNGTTWRVVLGR
jgi:hypothetical protein